jgi:hypothetical protein
VGPLTSTKLDAVLGVERFSRSAPGRFTNDFFAPTNQPAYRSHCLY